MAPLRQNVPLSPDINRGGFYGLGIKKGEAKIEQKTAIYPCLFYLASFFPRSATSTTSCITKNNHQQTSSFPNTTMTDSSSHNIVVVQQEPLSLTTPTISTFSSSNNHQQTKSSIDGTTNLMSTSCHDQAYNRNTP